MNFHRSAVLHRGYLVFLGSVFAAGLLFAAAAGAQAPTGDYLNVVGWAPLDDEVLKDQFVVFFDKPIQLPAGPNGSPHDHLRFGRADASRTKGRVLP